MRAMDGQNVSFDESALKKMIDKLTMMAEDFDDPSESSQ